MGLNRGEKWLDLGTAASKMFPRSRLDKTIQTASAVRHWIASAFAKASADKSLRSQ
jgi:hypothetical protein